MDKAMAETMIEESELHLEQPIEGINSHIPVAAKSGIDKKLADAIGQSDNETQALIHSGVPSLEAAMREYIEKYAKAMRIGEVAEKLKASLDCAAKVAKLNDDITTDKRKREEILAAIDALEAQIESGVQGKTYEEHLSKRIKDALDTVQKKIVELQREISDSVVDYCGVHKEDRLKPSEAESISRDWDEKFRHTESELKNRLSDCLLYGIKSSAEQFLEEYRRSVEIIMPRDEVGALPFDPFSLIGAELTIDSTIDSFTNKEEKSRQIKTGTEKKKNPEREGFLGLFKLNKPWLIDVDVFATEYYTEEYVEWVKYAQDVVGKVRAGIRRYCDEATEQAKANSDNMLADFKNKFNRLNKKLLKKASELREMSKNDETLKERIKKNQKLREDVKQLQARLNDILEI
jgi:DNA repair exonuclease SbcCD ATPase subunit